MDAIRSAAKKAWWIAAGLGIAVGNVASAQITLPDPLSGKNFQSVTANVIGFIFYYIAIPLATIMVLVGAFQMMTSAGDPEKFSNGRKTLLYAAIGFVAALLAGGITSFIKSVFGIS